jgi:hypothetical protein
MTRNKRQFAQYVRHQAFQMVAGLPQDPEIALSIVEEGRRLLMQSREAVESAPKLRVVSKN